MNVKVQILAYVACILSLLYSFCHLSLFGMGVNFCRHIIVSLMKLCAENNEKYKRFAPKGLKYFDIVFCKCLDNAYVLCL